MKINKDNLMKGKAGISYLQILILILSSFAFSYIVYEASKELGVVEAQDNEVQRTETSTTWQYNWTTTAQVQKENEVWRCCQETNSGVVCQDLVEQNCEQECSTECLPAKCQDVVSCEPGCCFSEDEGLCSPNTPQQPCTDKGGKWYDNVNCNILECRLGCCILGDETSFITEKRCEIVSAFYGFGGEEVDFRPNVNLELDCLALAYQQAKGACVIESGEEKEKTCKFITKQECLQLTSSINFHENVLCTKPELNTNCKPTKETICIEGKDEVYFVDSCGNVANIYDASKINSGDYWSRVVSKENSCGAGDDNINSKTCGNCNRFIGSACDGKICKSLNCKDAPYVVDVFGKIIKKKDRVNGESWCVYDSYIGEGKDVVGSRHFKYYCLDGEVKIEPCADYRQEICVESVIEGEQKEFSNAACRINRWRECLKINEEKDQEKCGDNSDCVLKKINVDDGFKFDFCAPAYPSGFDFSTEYRAETSKQLCSMANQKCIVIYQKKIFGGWECVMNCDCEKAEFTQKMNELCISLGDCGGYVNILGDEDDAYKVSGAPKINLNQYEKYINPVEGQKAEPGDLSEMLAGMFGSEYEGDNSKIIEWMGNIGGLTGTGISIAAILIPGVTMKIGFQAVLKFLFFGGQEVGGVITWPGGWGAVGNMALGAVAGAIMGAFIAKMFGLQGDAAMALAITGGVGGLLIIIGVKVISGMSAFCGPLAWLCFLILLIVLILIGITLKMLGIGDTKEKIVSFNCYPWQAPVGGDNCEKCGSDLKPCSKYRCESLGQRCKFVNEGTNNELCIETPGDVKPAKISPWGEILSNGYIYQDVKDNGFKIRQKNGECIPEFSPVLFGIFSDEVTQCKFDVENVEYEQMGNYVGEDNLYKYNHVFPFSAPSINAFASEFELEYSYVLDKLGDMRFYVKCKDVDGNVNSVPYMIETCIKPGPDLTAPMIIGSVPGAGSYIQFNATKQPITLYINEPAECFWSSQDKEYEKMKNSMTCETGLQDAGLYGWECKDTLILNDENKFYFRCKDQPWLTGENETQRNANKQSYVLELKKSSGELKIEKIEPEKGAEIKSGNEPTSITLKAYTSGGAEQGKATCSYRFSEDGTWIWFKDTFSSKHSQVFTQMMRGTHNIYVKCEDVAGNIANGETRFKLKIDTTTPRIIRVYNEGVLKIITDEDAECVYDFDSCNFNWDEANMMTGLQREHNAEWKEGMIYHIKCKDLWDNKPDACSIIVKAV